MMQVDNALQDIKSRGYWFVAIRPNTFEKERLQIEYCKELVSNSIVSLRPYNYPYYYFNNCITFGTDYVECISDIRPSMGARSLPMSIWRMYQSGQFVNVFSCMEDYWEVSAGKNVLSVISTLYIMTEIYLFASRLVRHQVFDNGLSIRIELRNMKNRHLAEIDPGEAGLERLSVLNYKCNVNELPLKRNLALSEILGKHAELAVNDTMKIFSRFGWSSPYIKDMLIDEQSKLFRGIYSIRRERYPISIDDPVRDKQLFRDRLMEELCRKYNNLSRNTNTTDFIFDIEDIRKEGMRGFLRPYFDQKLPELQNEEGFIEVIPDGKIRLTERGVTYCKASYSHLY